MTITLDIQNDKLDVFLNFLKTLNYVKIKDNENEYLLTSKNNKDRLLDAIDEIERGKIIIKNIEDLNE